MDTDNEKEREKSVSEKKLEKVFGISDSLKKLNDEDSSSSGNTNGSSSGNGNNQKSDEDKKKALEERRKILEEMKKEHEILSKKDDNDFSRSVLKELTMINMEFLRINRKEMEMDPSARNTEASASMANTIVSAVDSLRKIENDKIDQGFEREKIDLKKSGSSSPGIGNNNVVLIGGYTDIMDKLELMKKEKLLKTVEVEAIKENI